MQINLHDITTESVFSSFCRRAPESNKGTYGKAVLICGSYGMAGAAVICAKACVYSGVGIANVICPKSVYPIIASQIPEAIFTPINEDITSDDLMTVIKAIKKASVVAIGCGMGQTNYTEKLLDCVITHSTAPIIIDADGINCLCHNIDLLLQAKSSVILTPHPGEMARLANCDIPYLLEHKLSIIEQFAGKYNCIITLKTHETAIMTSDAQAYINRTGNAGMACAGTGDMLCGMMASFIAQGLSVLQGAQAAVHIHGLCGDLSAKKYSMAYTTPTTMMKTLPAVLVELEKFSNRE